MRRIDNWTMCGVGLMLCLASGCHAKRHAERGLHRLEQCGNGHDTLLECLASKMGHSYNERCCDDPHCDDRQCDGYHQRAAPLPPPRTESHAEQDTRTSRRDPVPSGWRQRILNRLPDSMRFSVPLPNDWFGRGVSSATQQEEIPWDAPVAADAGEREFIPETQVVGYEYGEPVELMSPDLGDGSSAHR